MQVSLSLRNMHVDSQMQQEKAMMHTHTSTGSIKSLSGDWHLDTELRNDKRAVDAIKCSTSTAGSHKPNVDPIPHMKIVQTPSCKALVKQI